MADSRPDDVADSRPDDVADSRPDDVADSGPDDVADSRPDDVADSRPDDMADSPPDDVADSGPDDTAASRPDDVAERITIGVPPGDAYEAISHVRRMARWSPECFAVLVWPRRDGVPARFVGFNRRGPWVWFITCQVVTARPGA